MKGCQVLENYGYRAGKKNQFRRLLSANKLGTECLQTLEEEELSLASLKFSRNTERVKKSYIFTDRQ